MLYPHLARLMRIWTSLTTSYINVTLAMYKLFICLSTMPRGEEVLFHVPILASRYGK
jgi:hypothetical protein